jgi:hypothetical protein
MDGSALNLDASDPSFALSRSVRIAPRSARSRLRLRVNTNLGNLFTVNVSAGGACTEQMRVLPVGTQVDGHIHLDGRESPFTGRVTWVRSGDFRLNQQGRMGVCFERIDPGFVQGLAAREARLPSAAI